MKIYRLTVLSWPQPAAKYLLSHSLTPQQQDGWENMKKESQRTHGLRWRQVKNWSKTAQKRKSRIRNLSTTCHSLRQIFKYDLKNRVPACVNGYLGRCYIFQCYNISLQCYNDKCHLFILLDMSLYCWAWCHMVWNISLVSLDQLSKLCHLPASCRQGNMRSRKDSV